MYISKNRHVNQMFNLLIRSKDIISISEFEKKLDISRRSVYYSIKKINNFLSDNGFDTIINVKNLGFYLNRDTIYGLENIEDFDICENHDFFNFSNAQRIEAIIWFLINGEKISLTLIEKRFNVSRNTADKDFKKISIILEKYKLELIKNSGGHLISGPEIFKRNWIYEQFSKENPILFSLLAKKVNHIQNISLFLKEFERMTGNFFTDNAFVCLSTYLDWYINRIQNSDNRLKNTKIIPSNLIALEWAQKFLFKHNIVNLSEANYLINIIHSSQFNKANKEYGGIQKILPITKRIIVRFNQISGVELKLDSLQVDLSTHLLATYYRIKYGISYEYPDLDSIKKKYDQLFSFTRFAVKPFEEFVKKTIPDDEIALITLYFGGEIRAVEDQNFKKNCAVLIVCSSGIGTSRILKQQLEEKFPNISFSKPYNVSQYKNASLQGIKLIISTIDVQCRNNLKVIKVAAIPSKVDWENIESALQKENIINNKTNRKTNINIEGLLDIISEYARIEDIHSLKKDLKKYLEIENSSTKFPDKESQLSHRKEYKLTDIFSKQNILFVDHVDSFKQALQITFQPLINNGSVDNNYIDEINYLTERYGPYMMVDEGVLLAHAKPNYGVKKMGFSFLFLNNSVYLPKKNKKLGKKAIKIIIGFASTDANSHIEKLGKVLSMLQNKEEMSAILSASTKEDLLNYVPNKLL